ncbi:helix-turn-helix domain-containing protein [Anaerovibrio lipolyticus]|uniref:helix-turn-helix domain-containing protein n=1 Tax=Anaerovibrio lipolyticus TaxID=82374 RepID=UPI00068EC0E1|nr:helix-turn-helix transcriptional regulator [Anaerovibrio lipolyticus]
MDIGDRLKRAREKIRLSQKEVGEKAKINSKSISHWENGRALPSLLDLRTLANIYHVSTDWLIGDINAYTDALARQKKAPFMEMLFKNDPEMKSVIEDIQIDGSIFENGENYRLSDQNIAFIENAIRLAYKEAKATGQTVVEIKPKKG